MDDFISLYNFTRGLVAGAHAEHTYGNYPYVFHLNTVESIAVDILLKYENVSFDVFDDARIISQLHDLVEDTSFTYEQLKEIGYSNAIVEAVRLVTDPEGESRKERKTKLIVNLHAFTGRSDVRWLASIVKIADRIHNQGSTISERHVRRAKMYLREWPDFKESFVKYAASIYGEEQLEEQIKKLQKIVDEHENSPVQYAV